MIREVTLNPNSPGFSASKSYNAEQHGPLGLGIGVRAGDLIGDGNGDAKKYILYFFYYFNATKLFYSIKAWKRRKIKAFEIWTFD